MNEVRRETSRLWNQTGLGSDSSLLLGSSMTGAGFMLPLSFCLLMWKNAATGYRVGLS